LATLLPPLEALGFTWVEKRLDGGDAQVNAISLERERVKGRIDFVSIIFDKYRRARFQVVMGVREKAPPHRWVRGGRLIERKGAERYSWWGGKWWQLNRARAFENAVRDVAATLPQIIDYLDNGVVGSNIYDSLIGRGDTEVEA